MAECLCAAIRCGDPVNNAGSTFERCGAVWPEQDSRNAQSGSLECLLSMPNQQAIPMVVVMYFAAFSRFHGELAYGFRATNDSKGGIEKDVVKECSGGWVPS